MQTWIAIAALFIASWQLRLQRKEIAKANKIEKIKVGTDIIRAEIALREKNIQDEKGKGQCDWSKIEPHIKKVNDYLRPTLRKLESKIISLCSDEFKDASSKDASSIAEHLLR